LLRFVETFQMVEHVAAACFQPAMVLLHCLGRGLIGTRTHATSNCSTLLAAST
jgi:hypothetical protein